MSQSHPPHLYKGSRTNLLDFSYRCLRGEYSPSVVFDFRDLPADCLLLQIRAGGEPEQSACYVLNTESGNKTVVALLVTDVVLLLTMLVGLLRLRRHGTMFALGQLLWKQVSDVASLTGCLFFFLKGLGLALRGNRRGGTPSGQSRLLP